LLAVALGIAGWWWFNQPALQGMLELGENVTPLSGKRPVYIGSDPRCTVPLTDMSVLPRHARLRPIGSRKSPQMEISSVDPTQYLKINGTETTFKIIEEGDTLELGGQTIKFTGLPTTFQMDNNLPTDPNTGTPGDWKF
jgi:hypothetical protein